MCVRPGFGARSLLAVLVALACVGLGGCISQAAPAPAQIRRTAPPWDAPRDAVSHLDEAGLAHLPLNDTSNPWVLELQVSVDGTPVRVPANIGVDRRRAVQAAVHTHDDSGQVWLEGEGNPQVRLGEFFTLWGVHFDATCLGNACTGLRVLVDRRPVEGDPRQVVLRGTRLVQVSVTTR